MDEPKVEEKETPKNQEANPEANKEGQGENLEGGNQEPKESEETVSKKDYDTALAQKEHWRNKATKAQQMLKELAGDDEEEPGSTPKQPQESSRSEDEKSFDPEAFQKKLEERYDLRQKGYSGDEIARIESYANANKLTLVEAEQDAFVQAGIKALRKDSESENATPAPNSAPQVKIDGKPFTELNEKDRKDNYQEFLRQSIQRQKGSQTV